MSTHGPEAIDDYSKSRRPRTDARDRSGALRTLLAGLGMAGAILAFVATFTTVIEITVLTVRPASFNGMDRYGPALLVLGAFALLMIPGALRGARPAMAAIALCGLAVLLVAVLVDVPHLDDTGVWPQADLYEDASAGAGIGFYFETASGVLLLLSGVLLLLLSPRASAGRAPASGIDAGNRHESRIAAEGPPAATPEPAPAEEWFSGDPLASRAQRLSEPPAPRRRQGGLVGRLRNRDR